MQACKRYINRYVVSKHFSAETQQFNVVQQAVGSYDRHGVTLPRLRLISWPNVVSYVIESLDFAYHRGIDNKFTYRLHTTNTM